MEEHVTFLQIVFENNVYLSNTSIMFVFLAIIKIPVNIITPLLVMVDSHNKLVSMDAN